MRSLRRQLLRTLTLTLLAVFITQGFVLYGALVHLANSQTLLHLSHDSESVLSAIDVDGKGQLTLDEQRVESVYRHPGSGQYFLVLIQGGGRLASGSLGTHGLEARVPGPGQSLDYEARGPDGHPLKVLARSSVVQGRPVTLLVAEDMSLARQEIWETGLLSLAVFAPLLALALLLQGLAVSRALAPLRRVRDELAEVGAGHLARIQGPVPREVRPLVDEVNRLLVLLEQRVRQSRTAVGNLAHALKTPLAVLLQAGEAPGVPETLREAVRAQAGAIHERIDRELRRARLAGPGGHGAGAHFNPGAELPALVRMLKSVHHEKALGIEVQAPDRRLPFDREDMLELLGNLADKRLQMGAPAGADRTVGTPGARRRAGARNPRQRRWSGVFRRRAGQAAGARRAAGRKPQRSWPGTDHRARHRGTARRHLGVRTVPGAGGGWKFGSICRFQVTPPGTRPADRRRGVELATFFALVFHHAEAHCGKSDAGQNAERKIGQHAARPTAPWRSRRCSHKQSIPGDKP
jgi:hypothetical protein